MQRTAILSWAVACLAFTHNGYAQSLAQRQEISDAEPKILSEAAALNQSCGAKVEVKIDWASFAGDDWSRHDPPAWCLQPLGIVSQQCSTAPAFKSAFSSKVASFTCKKGGSNGALYSLGGTDLTYSIDWGASNVEEKLIAYLNSQF